MKDENSFTPLEILELFEGTRLEDPIIQKFLEWGMKQGLEQGIKQAREQGLQRFRATLVSFVKAHFSDQLALAQQQVGLITTPSQAQECLEKLFVARTSDEVRQILFSLPHA